MGGAEDRGGGDHADEFFLQRWSRRKTASLKDEPVAEGCTTPEPAATSTPAAAVDEDSPPQLTDADMPALDSLDSDSDFPVFMSPGVSDQLRTLALRKLFHLPAFNVTDGLNDYDEDYTQFTGLGNVVTQEMKRMLHRALEAEDIPGDEEKSATRQEPSPPAGGVTENLEDMDDDSGETV